MARSVLSPLGMNAWREKGRPEKGTRLFSMQPRAVPIRQQPRRQGLAVVERVQVVDVVVVVVVVVALVQGISSRMFSSLNWRMC